MMILLCIGCASLLVGLMASMLDPNRERGTIAIVLAYLLFIVFMAASFAVAVFG